MRALLRRPGFRVAGRTLLIAVMIVTVSVGAAAVAAATTLSAAPSIPPATSLLTTGSDGCIQLPASAIALVPQCDSPGGQAVTAVVKVVSFAEDPLGWLTDKMGQGASGIMSWVADTANNATAADLTSTWWIAVSYTHLRAHETDSYLVCR